MEVVYIIDPKNDRNSTPQTKPITNPASKSEWTKLFLVGAGAVVFLAINLLSSRLLSYIKCMKNQLVESIWIFLYESFCRKYCYFLLTDIFEVQ
jgi:hypothetical protein